MIPMTNATPRAYSLVLERFTIDPSLCCRRTSAATHPLTRSESWSRFWAIVLVEHLPAISIYANDHVFGRKRDDLNCDPGSGVGAGFPPVAPSVNREAASVVP